MICYGVKWHNISEATLPRRKKRVGLGWLGLARQKRTARPKLLSEESYWMPVSILEARAKFQGKGQIAVGGIYHFPNIYSHLTFSTIILNFPARQFAWHCLQPQQEALSPDWPKPFCISSLPWPQWLVREMVHVTDWMFCVPPEIYYWNLIPNVMVFGGKTFGK